MRSTNSGSSNILMGLYACVILLDIVKISSKSDVRLPRYCKFSSGVFFTPSPWFFTCGENLVPMRVKLTARSCRTPNVWITYLITVPGSNYCCTCTSLYLRQIYKSTNAQSADLRTFGSSRERIAAANAANAQCSQQGYFDFLPIRRWYIGLLCFFFIFRLLVESHLIRNKLWCDLAIN